MKEILILLAFSLPAKIIVNGYPIESLEVEQPLQEDFSRLQPFLEILKEQHYSSSETITGRMERSIETTLRNYQESTTTLEGLDDQKFRKPSGEVDEDSVKQLVDFVSNISKQLPELGKFVEQVQQYQIEVEEQVGTKYPNIGTLPDNLQELMEGPLVEAEEKATKFLTDFKIFKSIPNITLNPFIVFGSELELFLAKLVELYDKLRMDTLAILDNSQSIGPEVVLTVDNKCVFCEQRVSMMNMINQVGVFSQVVNDLAILYSNEVKKHDISSGKFVQRSKDI